jgi:hypothetical protein
MSEVKKMETLLVVGLAFVLGFQAGSWFSLKYLVEIFVHLMLMAKTSKEMTGSYEDESLPLEE